VDLWVLWLVLAVLLGAAEIATLTAAFGLLGGSRPGLDAGDPTTVAAGANLVVAGIAARQGQPISFWLFTR
jgi:hypothetical protein